MRVRSAAKKVGDLVFLAHCPAGSVRGWGPPVPKKGREGVKVGWEDLSILFTVRRLSHSSGSWVPSKPLVDCISLKNSHHFFFPSLCSRSFLLPSRPLLGASQSAQREENEPESDFLTVKETTVLALKEYLRDVKEFPDEEAEFVSRNCPGFMVKTVKDLLRSMRDKEKDSESIKFEAQRFIERADEDSSNERGPLEVRVDLTLGDMGRLSESPLALTGHEGLLKSMAIVDSLGWTRNRLWDMLGHNPEVLSWTAEMLQAKICYLEKLGVKRKDLPDFIVDSTVFTADLEERLTPMLEYLDEIGIEWDVLGDLLKFNPQGLIKMPLANFRERVDYLLAIGLSRPEVEKSMRVFPQLVHLRIANLTQKIEYFDGLGVDRDSMVKIVAKLPSIFRHSIERNLVPKVEFLESLGVVKSSLVRFIAQYPQFFGCSMVNLKQKLAFFQTNGLTDERLAKMLIWHPRMFSFSNENLSKKLLFLTSKGFVIKSTAMVRALTSCITISTDSLEARFQNLQALGFSAEQTSEIVKKQPTIFCLSEKSIGIKVDYLVNTMNRSSIEILKCPGYLLYSLELRIKPRHRVVELLTFKGLVRDDAYSLSTILQPSEKTFVQRFVRLHPECFDVYLSGVGETDGEHTLKLDQMASLSLVSEIALREGQSSLHPSRV